MLPTRHDKLTPCGWNDSAAAAPSIACSVHSQNAPGSSRSPPRRHCRVNGSGRRPCSSRPCPSNPSHRQRSSPSPRTLPGPAVPIGASSAVTTGRSSEAGASVISPTRIASRTDPRCPSPRAGGPTLSCVSTPTGAGGTRPSVPHPAPTISPRQSSIHRRPPPRRRTPQSRRTPRTGTSTGHHRLATSTAAASNTVSTRSAPARCTRRACARGSRADGTAIRWRSSPTGSPGLTLRAPPTCRDRGVRSRRSRPNCSSPSTATRCGRVRSRAPSPSPPTPPGYGHRSRTSPRT